MASSGGSRPLDAAVLLIGFLGILLVYGLCVLALGWIGLIVAGPFVGLLAIFAVMFA